MKADHVTRGEQLGKRQSVGMDPGFVVRWQVRVMGGNGHSQSTGANSDFARYRAKPDQSEPLPREFAAHHSLTRPFAGSDRS